MPEIEITVDQREYLEDLQAELDEDVVYGHVRLTDALQFLIDSREGELTADEEEAVDSAAADKEEDDDTDSATADEEDAEAESNGDDGRDDDASDAEGEAVGDADDEAIDDAEIDEKDAEADETDVDESDAETGEEDADDADEDESEDDAEPAAAPTPGGGGDRLNAMMQLLDTHDEKWREASGDARYEVDLPDGSTETANTKDDVRALLFKNY